MRTPSQIHSSFDAKEIRSLVAGKDYSFDEYEDLWKVGLGGLDKIVNAMDSIQADKTVPSIATPLQFLQNFLPGLVKIVTAARKIDNLIGKATVGTWESEQFVQGMVENTGVATPYGDLTNVPLSNYNVNFVQRTIIRYEAGMRIGILEAARVAAMNVSADKEKRDGAALSLAIARNQVGFYGYNSGNNNTYGFLNDPNLPAYNTVATGAATSSKLWSVKNWQEIVQDLLTAIQGLRTQSQDTINAEDVAMTLAVATDVRDYLSTTNEFGISVMGWLEQTYPKIRVESAPQLNNANGGANVFYLYADSVPDMSTDDGKTFIQVVPADFQVIGVQRLAKGYEEAYSMATGGVMCKRPYAVYRATGI